MARRSRHRLGTASPHSWLRKRLIPGGRLYDRFSDEWKEGLSNEQRDRSINLIVDIDVTIPSLDALECNRD